ncbi:hypothetical protein H4R18_001084 [Coemansia javaensis]|uniref:Rad9-domain-containing protein n=1 Tax=Coemansia javaensis TaxID=2761396 RepID=A0A9W8HGG6_9FUNG|nr:hypothetical protein H4R18_001084 [Coemansia javaensis]
MEAEIPAASLKAFSKALQCLARIGSDISLEAQQHHLELIGINESRSAYASFTFRDRFFDAYAVGALPSSPPAAATAAAPALRCRVLAKPLVAIFKSRGPTGGHIVERCVLRIEQAAVPVHAGHASGASGGAPQQQQQQQQSASSGECRLVVRIEYKEGICRTHRLFYEECETLHPLYDRSEYKSRWRVSAKVAADWIGHFARGQEEVSLRMSNSDIRVRSWAEGHYAGAGRTQIDAAVADTSRALQTELTVAPAEFDEYHIASPRPVELTFGLREFKAILQYAEAMALPLSAYFQQAGAPLMLSAPDDLGAEFVLATLSGDMLSQSTDPDASPASAGAAGTPLRAGRGSPQVGSFTPERPLAATTPAGRMRAPAQPALCEPEDVQSSGGTPGLRWGGNGSARDIIDPKLVPSPSPYQSSRASNGSGRGMWSGVGVGAGQRDSLLSIPSSVAGGPMRTPSGEMPPAKSYRLLDMPRPQAPPGVTDAQPGGGRSDDSGDEHMAPPGMVQTRLPFPTAAPPDRGGADASSDEELEATPPPPSKRVRSLF